MISPVNRTTKRLLSAMQLGIYIGYADGHRWIRFGEDIERDQRFEDWLQEEHGIELNNKVYGNVIDALDYIDHILKKIGEKSLEGRFDSWNDFGLDDMYVKEGESWEDGNHYSEDYWEGRIH